MPLLGQPKSRTVTKAIFDQDSVAISIPHSSRKTQIFELAAKSPKGIWVPFSINEGKTMPIAKRLAPSVATRNYLAAAQAELCRSRTRFFEEGR